MLKPEAFQREHIIGSINIPQGNEATFEQRFSKDKEIVLYCASMDCHASDSVAEKLVGRGFTHVYDYAAGVYRIGDKLEILLQRVSMHSEGNRIRFLVERDGVQSARSWVERTASAYRRALESPSCHASRPCYRPLFEASIREFDAWLRRVSPQTMRSQKCK